MFLFAMWTLTSISLVFLILIFANTIMLDGDVMKATRQVAMDIGFLVGDVRLLLTRNVLPRASLIFGLVVALLATGYLFAMTTGMVMERFLGT